MSPQEAGQRAVAAHRSEGAALARIGRPRDIRLSAPSVQRMLQRAAPANYPTRCIVHLLSIRPYPDHRAASR